MIDCLLINSPDGFYAEQYVADPKVPLGLLHIAAVLSANGYHVNILDCHSRTCTVPDVIASVLRLVPRLIGINVTTPNRRIVFEIVNAIKANCSEIPVIVGGPHATSFPEDLFANADLLDAAVIGEGERVIVDIMNSLPGIESAEGVYTRDDFARRRPRRSAPRITDLDSLPFPDFDLIDIKKYLSVSPELYISASRGCAYDCAFCSTRTLLGNRVFGRTSSNVYAEMRRLSERYGVNSFYFYDENILLWPDCAHFCEEVSGLGVRWTAHGTLNDVKGVKAVKKLAAAGCYKLSFGFESGSRKIQKYIAKIIKEKSLALLPEMQAAGIETRGYFVVGVPEETVEDVVDTLLYLLRLRSLGLTDIAVFPARPYPGTRLFQDCVNRFGDGVIPALLDYYYLDDWKSQGNEVLRQKLKRYNTLSAFQINANFTPWQVRELTVLAGDVFLHSERYVDHTYSQMREVVLQTLAG